MYDYVFISDTHLGSKFAKTALLETFLKGLSPYTKNLFLVGDTFDFWKPDIKDVDILPFFRDFAQIYYLIGNHDLCLKNLIFLSPNILEEAHFEYQQMVWHITHGHAFDPSFGHSSWLNTMLDKVLYNLSKLLHWDIRTSLHFLTEKHYQGISSITTQKMQKQYEDTPFDVLICGHTHCPESKKINSFHVFNLGSWMQRPFALFVKGEQYAFIEITKDKLCPQEEDFNDIRGLRAA